jgi:hypothetical protein
MKVRNINGTTDNECSCGSWIKHWEKISELTAEKCSELSCTCTTKKELVGAHVQKEDVKDNSWYIIPLCGKHNGLHGQTIEVKSGTKLISANKFKTCEANK